MSYESENLLTSTERYLHSQQAARTDSESRIARIEIRIIELEKFRLKYEPYLKAMALIEPNPSTDPLPKG